MKFKFLLVILVTFQLFGCSDWGNPNSGKLDSRTLHIGFNGLSDENKRQFYEDKQAVEKSWLKTALSPVEFKQLIDQVDFEKQFVLVYSFGKRANTTGVITMDRISYDSDIPSRTSYIDTIKYIGVADIKECGFSAFVESFPFIVQLIDRPKNGFKIMGGSDGDYNFDGGCAKPIAGKVTRDGDYLASKTLHVGFNGLRQLYSKEFYEDKKTIENSWLKAALTPSEMTQLINQVDFKKQFVLVYLVGERSNITKKITMDPIRVTTDMQSKTSTILATINIGNALNEYCNTNLDIRSFPFVVQLVDRPENGFKLVKGHYAQYWQFEYGNDCAKPMAGQATPP